jgi:hypothetical protein
VSSWDRWDLQMLTTKLDRKQISLKEARLHVLRLGYHVKGSSKESFLREFARQQREGKDGKVQH